MLFNIPQFIDKEDKIVGPFTAKQLGWMFGGGTALLILWAVLGGTVVFFISAIPICAITGALAFYHPNGQPLISFILSSIGFFYNPKVYIWRRIAEREAKKIIEKNKNNITKVRKEINPAKIEEISRLLDRR